MSEESPPPLPPQNSKVTATDGGLSNILYPRLAVVLVVAGIVVFGAWWLATRGLEGSPLRCFFHSWTGLHCPGCGMTRATSAVFQGHFIQAFGHNPLGLILLPIALFGVALEAHGWVRGIPPRYRLRPGKYGYKIIAGALVLFFLLRNLPWPPFSYLAP